jgi:hypothetical protein
VHGASVPTFAGCAIVGTEEKVDAPVLRDYLALATDDTPVSPTRPHPVFRHFDPERMLPDAATPRR